jgi:hypothetical protein
LVEATQTVDEALRRFRRGQRDLLEIARQKMIKAVDSLLAIELAEAPGGSSSDQLHGPSPDAAKALSAQAAATFSVRLGKAMKKQGYKTPPPPEVDDLVRQAKQALMRARDFEIARSAGRATLQELLERLKGLPDKDVETLADLLTLERVSLWVWRVLLSGAVIDLAKDDIKDGIEGGIEIIIQLLRDAEFGLPPPGVVLGL